MPWLTQLLAKRAKALHDARELRGRYGEAAEQWCRQARQGLLEPKRLAAVQDIERALRFVKH